MGSAERINKMGRHEWSVMDDSGRTATDDIAHDVVEKMRDVEEPASLDTIVRETDIEDRAEAKVVMRGLINDGKVSTTPDWDYKLASRFRQ